VVELGIAVAYLLLLVPLPPVLIKGIGIKQRANRLKFVCCESIGVKMILLTELV
jgi:hypothetical protein